jgi:hypothetical protein
MEDGSMKTIGRITRAGEIRFGDAGLGIWEDGIAGARAAGGYPAEKAWSRQFKRDVFARVVQTLNRLGWQCALPPVSDHDIKHYGGDVARWASESRRNCRKGDLFGELHISGRCISFDMWQSVHTPNRPDHGGKHEPNKEAVMPYLLRLEMERTRRRIRNYLCNVFTGYAFSPSTRHCGPDGLTALEWVQADSRACWHHKSGLGRRSGEEQSYNNRSADDGTVRHGAVVWYYDRKGRLCRGTTFYNINNMWWVITGRYDVRNLASFELLTRCPDRVRLKRNSEARRRSLEGELHAAVTAMNFERAAVLRDILFPGRLALYVVWNTECRLYHKAGFRGYTPDQSQAGKFTADEVRGWDGDGNQVIAVDTREAA